MAAGVMKQGKRLTREDYQSAMLAAVDQGRFDISLNDLCRNLGVSTGSFYSHYDEMAELHREVAGIWLQGRATALAEAAAKSENGVRRSDCRPGRHYEALGGYG
jgi:AcrR family transcriptional regulator